MLNAEFGLKSFPEGYLFHVGTLKPEDKQNGSQEGAGLSVTTCPKEWSRITPLQGPTWVMARNGNQFVDAHSLTDSQRQLVNDWAVVHEWVTYRKMWEGSYNDDELGGQVTTLFNSWEEAETEFEGWEENEYTITEDVRPVPTDQLLKRMLAIGDANIFADDWALIVFVEDTTDYDGVWFEDKLDVYSYSGPRGVINLRSLAQWNAIPT